MNVIFVIIISIIPLSEYLIILNKEEDVLQTFDESNYHTWVLDIGYPNHVCKERIVLLMQMNW